MGILFMRAITLDGAGLGIYHFFHIKWGSFLNSETWIDSATQVLKHEPYSAWISKFDKLYISKI